MAIIDFILFHQVMRICPAWELTFSTMLGMGFRVQQGILLQCLVLLILARSFKYAVFVVTYISKLRFHSLKIITFFSRILPNTQLFLVTIR